jgi:hypothetical protein
MQGAHDAVEAGRYADYKAEIEAGWAAVEIASLLPPYGLERLRRQSA